MTNANLVTDIDMLRKETYWYENWLSSQSRAACLLSNLYCVIDGSKLKQKTIISPLLSVTLNSEQYHSHIFGSYSFPTALPPCRHQHSLTLCSRLNNEMFVCRHIQILHTQPNKQSTWGYSNFFFMWQENKSACTWIRYLHISAKPFGCCNYKVL